MSDNLIELFNNLKPCPFCGGKVEVNYFNFTALNNYYELECTCCNMRFIYEESRRPVRSKMGTIFVKENESFEDLWNRRKNNE